MNSFKKLIPKDILKYLTVGIFGMGTYNIRNSIKAREIQQQLNKEIEKNLRLQELLNEMTQKRIECLESNNQILIRFWELNNKYSELNKKIENADNLNKELLNSENLDIPNDVIIEKSNKLINLAENVTEELRSSNDKLEKVIDIVKTTTIDSTTNFIKDFNPFESLQQLYSILNFEETLALTHLSAAIAILLCLISLVTVFYSEKLIVYFKIEEKYPKIGKFIQLRRKFQNYYFIWNVIIILFVIIGMIYINILILIS
uniref:LAGLIDADG endonuclease n=1 Tax=Clavaria fumosa TaxID=264083 RepID=A0A7T3PD24_9AGAR|nr:hypothetical protein KQ422_mgp031 [Clavaria fumosa]QPZ51169.1 hypothetical protein [Clavaria fumosa]